ncbi:MAG: urocanate hydratase, partial [Candidatus Aminicenantes bacterium]|nr:urocanate hydratase [Candidatus Aminicenantes bacterium]
MTELKSAQTIPNISLDPDLPEMPPFAEGIRRAPDRGFTLTREETVIALQNALRYIPGEHHKTLAPEFLNELKTRGRIYGYRFRPTGPLYGRPYDQYKGNCLEGKAFQVMIDNNLDFNVALYPYELVTYGETGQVCQNWMQYRLIKKYLEAITRDQTLVVESGHPLGLFRSHPEAPRVINTNGLLVGMFDNQDEWNRAMQLGVSNYGQMTAGGWMYIGPQGIVHGTFNTILNAGRMRLGVGPDEDMRGHLFVSSGLGGMSGAQAKAVEIAGGVGIFAEVDSSRIETRHKQGWVNRTSSDLADVFRMAQKSLLKKEPLSIAYHGNIVDLLAYVVDNHIPMELLSDQTSCHAPYDGGYCPQGLTFEERTAKISEDHKGFVRMVDESLKIHFELIRTIVERGAYFFDYGNAFMKAVFDAGVTAICKNGRDTR